MVNLVTAQQDQQTNQGKTPFICTQWVPMQQGPPSSLSGYLFHFIYEFVCRQTHYLLLMNYRSKFPGPWVKISWVLAIILLVYVFCGVVLKFFEGSELMWSTSVYDDESLKINIFTTLPAVTHILKKVKTHAGTPDGNNLKSVSTFLFQSHQTGLLLRVKYI